MTLNDLNVNETGVILTVGGEGSLRCRLLDMGLIPKTHVTMVKRAPMGDPVEYTLRGYALTLRSDDAKMIEIAKTGSETDVNPQPKRKEPPHEHGGHRHQHEHGGAHPSERR